MTISRKIRRKCDIVQVGKRRDGGFRYWCLVHHANATAKYGVSAERCVAASDLEVSKAETLVLDPPKHRGGIALWGAVPAIYDTTEQPIDRGIHVHTRDEKGGPKQIDSTYRSVRVNIQDNPLGENDVIVGELDAIYFMVSSVLEKPMKYVICTLCGFPHLDRDWFAVHKHRKHLCAGCGHQFADVEEGIGNPAMRLRDIFDAERKRELISANRRCKIRQRDYVGGIQIWGSNPAIVWTAEKAEEEGIHVHAYREIRGPYSLDNTYSTVEIDGITLDPDMVRSYMAQSVLPHIAGRMVSHICPKCEDTHFDRGELAYTPHKEHHCEHCGHVFRSTGRVRLTISNPMVAIVERLAEQAPRKPRKHNLELRPETL